MGDHYGLRNLHSLIFLSLREVNITCNLVNLVADITSEFLYENETDLDADVEFIFPIQNVAVYHFEAEIKERKLIALCRPRNEAQTTFEEATKQGHTAFLAEQGEHSEDIFKMHVGNIPKDEKIKIILKYIGLMELDNTESSGLSESRITLTLPSVLNPRYNSGDKKIKSELNDNEYLFVMNRSSYTINFGANIEMPYAITNVDSVRDHYKLTYTCDSHKSAKVQMDSEFTPDHDLQMVITIEHSLNSSFAFELGDQTQNGIISMNCLMAQFMPKFTDQISMKKETRNEIVFVIDRSGSMEGENMAYAKQSLLLFLKSLPKTCRFQLIGFGSTYEVLFSEPVDYTEHTLNQALDYQDRMDADLGGTEICQALEAALNAPLSGQGWYRQIILLTDGDIYNQDEVIGLIKANVHKARVFAIGLGTGSSSSLIAGVARAGRGISIHVRYGSQLQAAVMKILKGALQPRAGQIKMKWQLFDENDPVDSLIIPKELPPIFCGHFVVCFALVKSDISKLNGRVQLDYEVMGQSDSLSVTIPPLPINKPHLTTGNCSLHRLAAKFQIQDLTDEYHGLMMQNSEESPDDKLKKLKQEIELISCQFNIVSKFTSLIGVDPEKRRACYDVIDGQGVGGYLDEDGDDQDGDDEDDDDKDDSMPESEPKAIPIKFHVQLAQLQTYQGAWELNDSLAQCFGVPLEKMKQDITDSWPSHSKYSITTSDWATAFALALLQLKASSDLDEWNLFGEKALEWLIDEAYEKVKNREIAEQMCKDLVETAKNSAQKWSKLLIVERKF